MGPMRICDYYYESHFVKAKFIGKYIYFEDRFSDPMATVLFGLLGNAISSGPKPIILDTKTGLITILSQKNIERFLLHYPDTAFKYRISKKKMKDKEAAIIEINKLYTDKKL